MARWWDMSQAAKDEVEIIQAQAGADCQRIAEQGFQDQSQAWTDHSAQMLQNSEKYWLDRLSKANYIESHGDDTSSGQLNDTATWVDWNW